ncbi:MAG TPA: hypothetical protein VMV93_13070 [Chloroflexota bacterium]|nr:hypothetical protein [Chloroflexota bacterium]
MDHPGEAWQPSAADIALWRFFRLSRQQVMAGRCLTDGELSMATWPPDKLFIDAFMAKHAGHDVVIVSDELDRFCAVA